jgi:hypothetical protein
MKLNSDTAITETDSAAYTLTSVNGSADRLGRATISTAPSSLLSLTDSFTLIAFALLIGNPAEFTRRGRLRAMEQ